MYQFAIIKGFFDPAKNIVGDLPSLYTSTLTKLQTFEDTEDFLQDLHWYAKKYKEYYKFYSKKSELRVGEHGTRIYYILKVAKISTWDAFHLYVFANYSEGEEKQYIFKTLENYLMRRLITKSSNKTYSQTAYRCITTLKNDPDPQGILPLLFTDEAVQDTSIMSAVRKCKDNKISILTLLMIELARKHPNGDSLSIDLQKFTLEHICPQSRENTLWEVEGEEAQIVREEHCHMLGNMTILTGKANSGVSNKSFEEKKKSLDGLSFFKITREIIESPNWSESEIASRTSRLGQEFIKYYPYISGRG